MIKTDAKMNPLRKIDYMQLTQEQIENDIRSLLEIHPDYKTKWQDFLSSNAGQMLLQTFSYIASKMILRADFIANELFLPTSRDPKSIVNMLKLVGYNLRPPVAASTTVKVTVLNGNIDRNFMINPGYPIRATDLNGDPIWFELCDSENDYETPLCIEKGQKIAYFKAYAGSKREEVIIVDKREGFTFKTREGGVIDKSLKIYIAGKDGSKIGHPLEEISSLMFASKDEHGRPRYSLSYDEDFRAVVTFGKENYGGSFTSIIDGMEETYVKLYVVYRVGGGSNTNIVRGGINETYNWSYDMMNITVNVTNPDGAVGGGDGESIYNAKIYAPLMTKTVNKMVTPEDYVILLKQQNHVKLWNVSIDTPYENPQRVPYLFTYIYVSPQRNWSSFSVESDGDPDNYRKIPKMVPGETVENYKKRFQIRLNNFLNITGASALVELINDESLGIFEVGVDNEKGLLYPDQNENFTEYRGEAKVLYYRVIQEKKIAGIENIFRIANFRPFRIVGDLYCKKGYNLTAVAEKVEKALRERFSVENMGFNSHVKISEIYGIVHSFEEVAYFQVREPLSDIDSAGPNEVLFILPESVLKLMPNEVASDYDIEINVYKA